MRSEPSSLFALSPARAVWAVAWPMAALGVLRSGYYLVDSFWVGRMGPRPLAALGGSAFAWWIVTLTADIAATGSHARVARHAGGGHRERIGGTVVQAAWLALVSCAVLAVAAYPLAGTYFDLIGFARDSAEHRLGREFVHAALFGASSLAIYAVVGSAFRGLGQTRTALVITGVTLVVNALLDPLFIWGVGPIGGLGISGAAWATAVANLVGAVIGVWLLGAQGHAPRFALPDRAEMLALARIGGPVSISGVGFALCYVLLGRVITGFGSEQMGGLGVGHRLEGIAYLVGLAFGVGAATMVGQSLGARQPERARECVKAAARTASLAMVPIGVVLFVFADGLLSLFTDHVPTIDAGALYLRIQTSVLVLMALEEVYLGAFAGAADTLAVSVFSFVLTAARVPLAWWFAHPLGLGITGVWIAIAGSTALKGLVLWWWWERGAWQRASLIPD